MGSLGEHGWTGAHKDKLWRYNQHYFDYLNAIEAPERNKWHLTLLEDWVQKNKPGNGVGWESYPISLRIVNWIKWALAGNDMPTICLHSLAVQVRFLSKKIEWHLLGNHVIANAKALIFAGIFFSGREADSWLKKGLRILNSQILEQVLEDGGHIERSPMYHAIVLEDLIDLLSICQGNHSYVDLDSIEKWKSTIKKMIIFLNGMTHPDGGVGFFNDAALNVAPKVSELIKYSRSLGVEIDQNLFKGCEKIRIWDKTGYIIYRNSSMSAILDVAPIGPDYQPGHAHADTLSFELSLNGCRIIVNGGTSCYANSNKRQIERETRNHSTLEMNGCSSSEVWGGFRVGRRATPNNLRIIKNVDKVHISCSHNGYARFKGKPIHQRDWYIGEYELTVDDYLNSASFRSVSRFIIHPEVKIKRVNTNSWMLLAHERLLGSFEVICGNSSLELASYAKKFGEVCSTNSIVVEQIKGFSRIRLNWS